MIEFAARWREELVATSPQGTLVFELTMGALHVYFPDEPRWRVVAPEWAREQWPAYRDACRAWCEAQRIPFTLVPDAHVSEER